MYLNRRVGQPRSTPQILGDVYRTVNFNIGDEEKEKVSKISTDYALLILRFKTLYSMHPDPESDFHNYRIHRSINSIQTILFRSKTRKGFNNDIQYLQQMILYLFHVLNKMIKHANELFFEQLKKKNSNGSDSSDSDSNDSDDDFLPPPCL